MKDIDFDELDKAVNSLMSSVDKPQSDTPVASPQPAAPDSSAPTPAVTPAVSPASSIVQPPAPQVSPATPSQSVPVRQAAPAAKRSGRFMDMVSTSSVKPAPATSAPSREGLSITPRQTSTSPAAPVDSTVPEPVATPVVANMPDPLDMFTPASSENPSTATAPETAVPPTDEPTAPIESPFLADAKVEKRPLNPGTPLDITPETSQPDSTASEPMTPVTDELSDDASVEESQKGEDEPPTTPQVPELDSDLVAIESNEQVEATQATETADAASEVDTPAVPLGAASIAQQYKTTPSTGDQSHAAIYDASQYPQPVAHPAKHRSSWWWVLWVVLLLGVGAGGAILMYNLRIIP